MSAPDELAEMKRVTMEWRTFDSVEWAEGYVPIEGDFSATKIAVVLAADADRVIATERRENSEAIAARDARIAQLEEREMSSADLRQRITTLTERLASRDAQLAEARELLQEAYDYGTWWRGKRIYKWVTTSPNVPAKDRSEDRPVEPSGGEK